MIKIFSILFASGTLFGVIPSAQFFYPENFSVEISKQELCEIATDSFTTHLEPRWRKFHWLNENVVLFPFTAHIHAQSGFLESRKKISGCAECLLTTIPGIHSLCVGMVLRALSHTQRPFLQYIHSNAPEEILSLSQEHPLHIATHNVSLTPSSVNMTMDMREPVTRAKELVESILQDPPSLLMIEEGWHEEGLQFLCENLKEIYPHILHSVAPSIYGMSSGIGVFSKFPIESVKYVKLDKMPPPHHIPPRGIVRATLKSEKGLLFVYGGIHTQSMPDCKSVEARLHQIKQIKQFVDADAKAFPGCFQIIMGDMNTTPVDMFGHDNSNQPEGVVWREMLNSFNDLFLFDHDPVSGMRKKGHPYFLSFDNKKMGVDLNEPCASWYDGPFLKEPKKSEWIDKIKKELEAHLIVEPQLVIEKIKPSWGTSEWFFDQSATRARFDAILLPKKSKLKGFAEIRRIIMKKGSVSAASDHLPVHAMIWKD